MRLPAVKEKVRKSGTTEKERHWSSKKNGRERTETVLKKSEGKRAKRKVVGGCPQMAGGGTWGAGV